MSTSIKHYVGYGVLRLIPEFEDFGDEDRYHGYVSGEDDRISIVTDGCVGKQVFYGHVLVVSDPYEGFPYTEIPESGLGDIAEGIDALLADFGQPILSDDENLSWHVFTVFS